MPQGLWPNIFSAIQAFGFEFSQSVYISFSQKKHLPHEMGKETTTRSPTFRSCTSGPTSTTSPMNSWPRMSPDCIVGMKPLKRCRSEPQMAVEVIFTIASRLLRIFGSGTCSTRTSFLPCQQFALMTSPLFCRPLLLKLPRAQTDAERLRRPLLGVALTHQRPVGDDHLAQLDDLLEAAQVDLHLRARVFAEELREERARRAARRAVVEPDVDDRAAPADRRLEAHRARGLDLRPFERAPRDQLVRTVFGDLGVPLDAAARRLRDPVRAPLAGHRHRFEVTHEERQILEVAPVTVDLFGRGVDDDALVHRNLPPFGLRAVTVGAELPRAEHVERRHGQHVGRGEREPRLVVVGRRISRAQAREVERVAHDPRPERPGRSLALREDGDAARYLAQAEQTYQSGVAANACDLRHAARRQQL